MFFICVHIQDKVTILTYGLSIHRHKLQSRKELNNLCYFSIALVIFFFLDPLILSLSYNFRIFFGIIEAENCISILFWNRSSLTSHYKIKTDLPRIHHTTGAELLNRHDIKRSFGSKNLLIPSHDLSDRPVTCNRLSCFSPRPTADPEVTVCSTVGYS